MMTEKQAKVKALRAKLKSLSDAEKQALINRGLILTIEGHALSVTNTMLLYLQSNGRTPTVVGGYQQWRKAGRQVMKGEHGYTIWFPAGNRKENDEEDDSIRFYTTTVFDQAQTEAIGEDAPAPASVAVVATPSPGLRTESQPADNIMKGWVIV